MSRGDVKKEYRLFLVAFVCFSALATYLFWLAQRGLGTIDEGQYIDIPHRLALGDRLLIDEWNVSQLHTPLQYPLFILYYSLFGTEGIILFFRYLYVVCQVAVSVFVFLRLHKQYKYAALAGALMYCHYTIINCFALSYYTISMMASTVICALLFTKNHTKPVDLIAAGLFAGAAVLSEPLLAFAYFAYAAAVLIIRINKKKQTSDELLSTKSFLYVTLGVVISAAAFFIFVFSRAGIKETIDSLSGVFSDPQYFPTSLSGIMQKLFGFELFIVLKKIGLPLFLADVILLIAVLADKKRLNHRPFFLMAAGLLSLATLITIYVRFLTESRMFYLTRHIPLFIFGGFCCLMLQHKHENRRLIAFYCAGLVFSIILNISSANYTVVCLLGGVFSNIVVFPIAQCLFVEIREFAEANSTGKRKTKKVKNCVSPKRIASVLLVCVMIASPLTEVCSLAFEKNFLLFENLYGKDVISTGEEDPFELYSYDNGSIKTEINTKINAGPLKGIRTCAQADEIYGKLLKDLDALKSLTDKPVYVHSLFPWMYLYLDMPYSPFTAWYSDDTFATRQINYWKLYPERVPDYIYIPKVTCFGFADMDLFCGIIIDRLRDYFEFEQSETETGYFLKLTDCHF